MNDELAIKVQAFLDGELPEAAAREISSLIATDADIAALHKELKQTRAALAGFEKRIVVPETREFYWSKIQCEIERTETAQPRPVEETISAFQMIRRALLPVTGLAVLALVLFVSLRHGSPTRSPTPEVGLEVASVDASSMTYRDYESGVTLVWLSFPAENDLAHSGAAGSIN